MAASRSRQEKERPLCYWLWRASATMWGQRMSTRENRGIPMNDMVTAADSRPVRVTKDLVHKHDAGQVLLTGLKRLAEDEFLVEADWTNTGHLMAAEDRREGSAVLLTETIRQAFPLLSHAGYDVPFGHRLLWSEYRYQLNLRTLREEGIGGRPELHIRCYDVVRRRGRVSA